MKRGFFQSLAGIALLAGLLIVTAINVWQSNRIEKNQISLLSRLKTVERAIESGNFGSAGTAGPSGGIWGAAAPDYVTKALQDPKTFLKRDPTPWLPADAQQGGRKTATVVSLLALQWSISAGPRRLAKGLLG